MIISVEEAGVNSAEVISTLAKETFFETYSWDNTPENMRDYTQTHFNLKQTQKELAEANNWFFLAYADNEPAGYAKLRIYEMPHELEGKKHIEIERIYVLQKCQKKKIGVQLMKRCIDFSKERNFEVIWLGVWEQNPKAINFYESVGFTKFGEHVFQLGTDPQKDHLLKLDLTNERI